jgi:hypothetical protein
MNKSSPVFARHGRYPTPVQYSAGSLSAIPLMAYCFMLQYFVRWSILLVIDLLAPPSIYTLMSVVGYEAIFLWFSRVQMMFSSFHGVCSGCSVLGLVFCVGLCIFSASGICMGWYSWFTCGVS